MVDLDCCLLKCFHFGQQGTVLFYSLDVIRKSFVFSFSGWTWGGFRGGVFVMFVYIPAITSRGLFLTHIGLSYFISFSCGLC